MAKTKKDTKKSVKTSRPKKPVLAIVKAEEIDPLAECELLLKRVNQNKNYIRRLLNEDGTYKKKYSYQVTLAAQSLRLLQDCYLEIMSSEEGKRFSLTEQSREGNPRQVYNPKVMTYIRLDAMVRANLAALGLNMNNLIGGRDTGSIDDPLVAVMKALQQ